MSKFLSEKYASLEEYVPGEQPKDKKYIKLNTNESPFPPSEGVLRAVGRAELEDLRLYSDPTSSELKKKLAALYGVGEGNVYVANGSDDILNFSFMAFGDRGAVYPEISYGFYEVFAALYGIESEKISLRDDFSVNPADYMNKGKLVVIANPNAPTGLILPLSDIEAVVRSNPDSVVVIDEAYIDFGGESAVGLTEKYKNLLVVGTFSKSRSMAGARLGFAFGDVELIRDLEKLKYSTNPYNINRLTQRAGAAALDEDEYYKARCREIIENREYTKAELRRLGFYVTDSMANFVFAESPRISGGDLYKKLRERGILVRHFTGEKIKNFNRITVGSREEMEALITAVGEILEEENA